MSLLLTAQLSLDAVDVGLGALSLEEDGISWFNEKSSYRLYLKRHCFKAVVAASEATLTILCKSRDDERQENEFTFQTASDAWSLMDYLLEHIMAPDPPISSEIFSSVLLKTNVTCLKFVGRVLYAGVGDVLFVYEVGDSKSSHLTTEKLFNGEPIHGIYDREQYLIVTGGKSVAFLRPVLNSKCNCKPIVRTIYRFRAVDWILDCAWMRRGRQIALLTANNALCLYDLLVCGSKLLSTTHCEIRSLLYSGKILGNSWEEIAVLAGTVFASIIVWTNEGLGCTKSVKHQLSGHKGVIFSIDYCSKTDRICSTSDDRSLRVWDVVFIDDRRWSCCLINLKYSYYGHSARVWKGQIISNGRVVSVGEDSRVCLWNDDGTILNQWNAHQDGEVWSLNVSEELNVIATGGSDGAVNLWPIKEPPFPVCLAGERNEKPKCVGLLRDALPFKVSWDGSVFLFRDGIWKVCSKDLRFSNYCLHSISADRTLIALGSISGCIVVHKLSNNTLEKIADYQICDGRIYSLMWLCDAALVICQGEGIFSIWRLTCGSLTQERTFILPYSKERWITCCASNEQHVVCGDRFGSLYVYLIDGDDRNPVYIAKRIHGHNGVTDIKMFDGRVVSVGRDGKYREFIWENGQLLLLRCSKLKLDWAAAVMDDCRFGRILLCFHEVFFVAWSVRDRRAVFKIDCGGGHRSWDCLFDHATNSITVIYIKDKTVHCCRIPMNDVSSRTVIPGGHPKAINAAALVQTSDDAPLVLLGGEDTTLRLFSVRSDGQIQLNVLQSHLSSVRAIACSNWKNITRVASGGGRGQIILWTARFTSRSVELIESCSHCILQSSHKQNEHKSTFNDGAEMRVMNLQFYDSPHCLLLAAGCSDGTLRIFALNDHNSLQHIQDIDLGHCILTLLRINKLSVDAIVASCTNGSVFFYPISEKGKLNPTDQRVFPISDSGINSSDYSCTNDHLVFTCAGDSAHIHVLLFSFDLSLLDEWIDDSAHTCQVSGLKMIDSYIFTVGLDQRLSVFSWKITNESLNVNFLAQMKISIPDVHDLLTWRVDPTTYAVYVLGLGQQLVHFKYPLSI